MRFEPQLCADFQGTLPKDAVVEVKEDGIWAQWDNGVLVTREGRRIKHRYPDVTPHLPKDCVLVMELCVFEWGPPRLSRFEQGIQCRAGLENPTEIRLRTKRYPVTAYVFDVLEVNGVNLASQPLRQRRQALEQLLPAPVVDASGIPRVILAEQYPATMFGELRSRVEAHGFEGLVIKDASAPHKPGRSSTWLKWKDFKEGVFEIQGYEVTDNDGFCIHVPTRAGPQRVVVNDVALQAKAKKSGQEAVIGYLNHTLDGSLRQPFVKAIRDKGKVDHGKES